MTEREKILIPKLTPEFLDTLREIYRVMSTPGDWVEYRGFIESVFELAGKDPGDLTPCEEVLKDWPGLKDE